MVFFILSNILELRLMMKPVEAQISSAILLANGHFGNIP